MRLLRGVYEGPGSHGVLRVAASIEGAHAVLRGLPSEGYFPALYGAWQRSGEPPAFSLSPVWEREDSAASRAPGDLGRDVSSVLRRRPETEAVVVARSEAALLSGEPAPDLDLPGNPATGRKMRLASCGWMTPDMSEYEAADLALEELVQVHARTAARSPSPTVNLFGPPVFGPNAAAEYAEAERLLAQIGVGVNARVPLGASCEDLIRLPRAWANVLLYREVGDSATLYLQDEMGIQRVTTPMFGSAGTGAALRSVGELCEMEPDKVQRAVFSELAGTARLPWYARLQSPEALRDRRVAIFGDFTYSIGLGYVLAREVGLEVAVCGTYLLHLERDFLFHASTFTDDAFATDDPDEVAACIEAASPDIIIGTRLEEEVARSLGVPFLPLCPPVAHHPFAERPLMGYAGSSVLADSIEDALRQTGQRPAAPEPGMPWSREAMDGLEGIPAFLRGRARRLAEERARERGAAEVTRRIFEESRS